MMSSKRNLSSQSRNSSKQFTSPLVLQSMDMLSSQDRKQLTTHASQQFSNGVEEKKIPEEGDLSPKLHDDLN